MEFASEMVIKATLKKNSNFGSSNDSIPDGVAISSFTHLQTLETLKVPFDVFSKLVILISSMFLALLGILY